jgi:Zn-dependent protease
MESGAAAAPKKKNRASSFMIWTGMIGKLGKLVKLLKVFKFTKVWLTLTTMALSVVVYAFAMGGWWFATGLVMMLFVHEMGHVWALRRDGLPSKAPVFIPMLGAVIFAPDMGDREQEARVGYAGPLLGSIGTVAVFLVALATSGELRTILLLTAYLGAFINLFNLMIPIRPLDGGRVMQIVGEWVKYVGLAIVFGLIIIAGARGMIVILILVMVDFRWPLAFKATFGILAEISLIVMIAFGLGEPQPAGVDVVDLFLATLFNLSLLAMAVSGKDEFAEQHRPNYTRWPTRLKWGAYYLGLMIGLALLMAQIVPMLPKEVTGG